jgi:tryptophan-rich sensory protein
MVLFFVQLILNTLWSVLFFGLHQPMWAFFEILVLWLFILLTLIAFWRIALPAGLLLVPYLLWVSFASALNFAIWRLNT